MAALPERTPAERGGFEPPVPASRYDSLANCWFQPLTHLSCKNPSPPTNRRKGSNSHANHQMPCERIWKFAPPCRRIPTPSRICTARSPRARTHTVIIFQRSADGHQCCGLGRGGAVGAAQELPAHPRVPALPVPYRSFALQGLHAIHRRTFALPSPSLL